MRREVEAALAMQQRIEQTKRELNANGCAVYKNAPNENNDQNRMHLRGVCRLEWLWDICS